MSVKKGVASMDDLLRQADAARLASAEAAVGALTGQDVSSSLPSARLPAGDVGMAECLEWLGPRLRSLDGGALDSAIAVIVASSEARRALRDDLELRAGHKRRIFKYAEDAYRRLAALKRQSGEDGGQK